jgi:hypothetical protein
MSDEKSSGRRQLPAIVEDVGMAALLVALAYLVVEFTQGPGIQFVYFAF